MNPSDMVMAGSYDYRLVALSVLISVLGAYAARELYERVSDARWFALDPIPDAHPALRRQLADAGLAADDVSIARASLSSRPSSPASIAIAASCRMRFSVRS